MRWLVLVSALLVTACDVVVAPDPAPPAAQPAPRAQSDAALRRQAEGAARNFVEVIERVEPVAERECLERAPRLNCDFLIVVDDRPGQPPNAFQTDDKSGRPVVAFTLSLITTAQNTDELAFVLGHEAAHHIAGHLQQTQMNAAAGAAILSGILAGAGASADVIRTAQEVGAAVGARTYSKEFELEADRLGTIIAARAGYDPVRGAAFFTRIPDPGDRFLGSHPPNADRIETVRRTAAGL